MLQATKSILHNNYFIKLFASKSAFYKQLERGNGKSLLSDLFVNETTLLAKKIILANYTSNLQSNWDIKDFSFNTNGNRNNAVEDKGNNNIVKK